MNLVFIYGQTVAAELAVTREATRPVVGRYRLKDV
jgi:hypothetical protein